MALILTMRVTVILKVDYFKYITIILAIAISSSVVLIYEHLLCMEHCTNIKQNIRMLHTSKWHYQL